MIKKTDFKKKLGDVIPLNFSVSALLNQTFYTPEIFTQPGKLTKGLAYTIKLAGKKILNFAAALQQAAFYKLFYVVAPQQIISYKIIDASFPEHIIIQKLFISADHQQILFSK